MSQLGWVDRIFTARDPRERIRFHIMRYRLARDWAGGEDTFLRLSADQEMRLAIEEWADNTALRFTQAHRTLLVRLGASVNGDLLEARLNDFVGARESLRACFEPVPGDSAENRQDLLARIVHSAVSIPGLHRRRILPGGSVPLRRLRLSDDARGADEFAYPAVFEEAVQPFDLATVPLLRATLLECAAGQTFLALVADNLIADWESLVALAAHLLSTDANFAVTPDAVDRRRERDCRDSILFWQTRWDDRAITLLGCDDLLQTRPAPTVGSRALSCRTERLNVDLAVLRSVQEALGVSISSLFFSAMVLALRDLTQKTSFSVWTHCRPNDVDARVFGPVATAHALSVDLSDFRYISEVVQAVHDALTDTVQHCRVSLDLVWRASAKSWLPAPNQSLVCVEHIAADRIQRNDVNIRFVPLGDTDERLGLQLLSFASCDEVSFTAAFSKRRFSVAFIRQLLDRCRQRLEDVMIHGFRTHAAEIDPKGDRSPSWPFYVAS